MRFAGKVAAVVGASRGIGAAAARRLAGDGAAVVLAARSGDALATLAADIAAQGGTAAAHAADITRETDMAALAACCRDRFGGLDLLFVNAGTIVGVGPLTDTTSERFDATLAVNLRGPFLALRALLPLLVERRGTAVINSAGSGLRGRPGLADYCAAKWGVIGLALSAAQEVGPAGVRVNVVAPGYVATDAWLAMLGPRQSALAERVPLRRTGEPEEVADVVAWLLSDEARYVSGAVVPIDGGMLAG